MPTKRSTSRGRPPKQNSRSTSASRKVKPSKITPVQQQKQKKRTPPRRISISPQQKSIPRTKSRINRSSSRTRKVNTAPPAVSAKKKKETASGSRPSSPLSYTSIKTTTLTATRGPPRPATASPLPFTYALRGSISPPTLRSRTSAATIIQRGLTNSPQPKKSLKRRITYFEQIKNSTFTNKLKKIGNYIKKGTYSIANNAKNNWRILFLLFFLLLLIGIFYKFNKELLKLNRNFVEFAKEQYAQQRHIFGEVWIKFQNVSKFVWNEYINNTLINKKLKNNKIISTSSPKIKIISTTTISSAVKITPSPMEEDFNEEDEF